MPSPKASISTAFPLYTYELRSSDARESECPPRKYETLESTHNTVKHANAALAEEAENLSSHTELNKWIKDQDEDGLYYWYARDRGSKYRHYYHLGIRRRKAKEDELASMSADSLEQIRLDSMKQYRRAELRADPDFVESVRQDIVDELKKEFRRDKAQYEALRLRMEGALRKEIKNDIRLEEGEAYWRMKVVQEGVLKRKRDDEDAQECRVHRIHYTEHAPVLNTLSSDEEVDESQQSLSSDAESEREFRRQERMLMSQYPKDQR